jgi:tRNA A-37 threonylcarbamoyl transferase component Bud32
VRVWGVFKRKIGAPVRMSLAWVQRDVVMLELGKVTKESTGTVPVPESPGTALSSADEQRCFGVRLDRPFAFLWAVVSLPFFGFGAVCGFIALLALLDSLKYDHWGNLVWFALYCGFCIALIALGCYFAGKSLGNGKLCTFSANPQGLHFGDFWISSMLGRVSREWADVHSIECTSAVSPAEIAKWRLPSGSSLIIDFKSGGSALIEIDRMERQDVEDLFLMIERNTGQSVLSKKALLLERGLMAVDNAVSVGYTSIWTDALDTQFAATHFEPLRTTTTLQNGLYEVRMQLASGGLSAVYLAQTRSKAKVIVKESVLPLDTDERTRKKAKELFEREGRLLARLDHPQIANVMDFFVEGARDYIVLQYIPGESLRQRVRSSRPPSTKDVARWSLQIAQILTYLHGLEPPVIHRDLTPDNLLIRDDGTVMLIDFGVSNEFVSKATGTLVGKQAYIPPEQFRGKSEPKSDIYAFGATLHFLLAGDDPEPLSMSSPLEDRQDVPTILDELVRGCTNLDADKRPDAQELVTLCQTVCEEMGVT